eukprot:gnl/TRDRNA2_/TRDRNA2_177887_c4_seq2.p1 gnl/TRDRNA2_/TRDRNA2_177887_c4~~gnl/TRDRNA2_/TRDRNA2_177887_c4_seq2.p1  ORF type:complete len:114 (-),score=32.79 gnl/TRDRNA2_/TRDRNA2_177887_c4_seq2:650-991(-)
MNVVTAVFIAEMNKAAAADNDLAMRKKKKDCAAYMNKVRLFFEELDVNGDGVVAGDELNALITDTTLKLWLTTLDIDANDLVKLFRLLDNGSGEVAIDDCLSLLAQNSLSGAS